MASSDVNLVIAGDASGAIAALEKTQQKAAETSSKTKSSFEDMSRGVGGSLDGINEKLQHIGEITGIAVAFEGLKKLGEEIERIGEKAVNIRNMSDILGITGIQFQAMGLAATEAGISQEQLYRSSEKLNQLLAEAREHSGPAIAKLHELGITQEEISDKSFGLAKMLALLSQRLNDPATAAVTMAALTKELGLRGSLAAGAIKALADNLGEWGKKAQEVNALSDAQTAKLKQMKVARDEFLDGWENKLAISIVGLGRLWDAIVKVDTAQDRMAGGTGRGKPTAFAAIGATQSAEIGAMAAGGSGDAGGEKGITDAALQQLQIRIQATKEGSAERLALERDYAAKVLQFYGGDTQVKEVREANAKVIEETRAFHDAQLKLDERRIRDKQTMTRDMAALAMFEFQEDRKWLAESVKADEIAEQTRATLAQLGLESFKQVNQQKLLAGLITTKEELEGERSAENQSYAIQLAGLKARLALAQLDVVERARINGELEILERKHQAALALIDAKGQKDVLAPYTAAINSVTSQWDSGIAKMLKGQMTLSQGMRAALGSIGDAFDEMISKSIMALVRGLVQQKLVHKEGIMSDAGKAASGAFAAVAGIPYVGPFLAPVAAAGAFAATMAFSAAGGFDVPSGLNPLTQLHEREMVLPAHLADPIRDMVGGRRGGGGQTIHQTINAIDSRSLTRALTAGSGSALGAALRAHARSLGISPA